MPRETFERELSGLQDETLLLGSMVEQAVRDSVEALMRRELNEARRIYAGDSLINENRYRIETECLALIARQQPMARDLRLIAAIMEIITELERIGDYAKGIARINILVGEEASLQPPMELRLMADLGLDMLHRALGAFIARDAETARLIPAEDDQVDALYNQIYRELLGVMIADPATADHANYLLWSAHNLERLADRVTNICERTVFVVTGEIKDLDHSDDEYDPATPVELS